MAFGIQEIGVYIPAARISNLSRATQFGLTEQGVRDRLGFMAIARKADHEKASSLAMNALSALLDKADVDKTDLGCLVVVTQNPDQSIPHTAAIVHGEFGLPGTCACFDISLGCSGYVYGLAVVEGLMQRSDMRYGVLITADPYSGIVDPEDRSTALLFGDAATATLVGPNARFRLGEFSFGTAGESREALVCREQRLSMNGRSIFEFCAKTIPDDITEVLTLNGIAIDAVDRFYFHQASRFLVETLARRLRLDPKKASFRAAEYGNTVSSSIPILLESDLEDHSVGTALLSGFGVGLSWASVVAFRNAS